MTGPAQLGYAPEPAPPAVATEDAQRDVVFAAVTAVALAVLGAVLGLVWAAWSPPGPRAFVVHPGVFIPDETEAFVAGDGRFLVIVAAVGVLAGLAVWWVRGRRGPVLLAGLVIGGIAGALLTELVGHLTGGGTFDGAPNSIIDELPLSLHAHGLLFVEPGAAALVYGLFVAFAVHDDLGRADPVRTRLVPPPPAGPFDAPPSGPIDAAPFDAAPSVDAGGHPQHRWGHGDAAGALQQPDLPPQQTPQPD